MTRMKTIHWLALAGILGATTYSSLAHAQEFSLILLDRTGSMSEVTARDVNNNPISTRWTDAIDAAKSLITDDFNLGGDRSYAIWDFRVFGVQTTAEQVWPLVSTDCPAGTTFTSVAAGLNNYCTFPPTLGLYNGLRNRLEGYKLDPNRAPDPNFFGRTPLASALCRALDQLGPTIASGGASQTITVESDGLENESPAGGICGNSLNNSTNPLFVNNSTFTFVKAQPDWELSGRGGASGTDQLMAGSWEARIVRRALRLNMATAAAVTNNPIPANLGVATNIAWRVDAHYRTCASGQVPCADGGSLSTLQAAPLQFSLAGASTTASSSASDAPASAPRAFALLAGPTVAAAAVTPTKSISTAELNLFRNLASSAFPRRPGVANRAKFREIIIAEGQVFGVNHVIPGDVDDSGCTDQADLNIVMQKDVYFKRAVAPCQICTRADLSRDGWVNEKDRALVINNWGAHTTQPCRPGPKPAL